MSTIKAIILAASLVAATSATASAHDLGGVDRTQAWQLDQIEQQRRNGQLTRREHGALIAEQGRIAEIERHAKADGRLTGREVRAIREAQAAAGQHIYEESHDRQVNWWRRWKSGVGRGY